MLDSSEQALDLLAAHTNPSLVMLEHGEKDEESMLRVDSNGVAQSDTKKLDHGQLYHRHNGTFELEPFG